MKSFATFTLLTLLCSSPTWAQHKISGQPDDQNGSAARALLQEQAEGKNRADSEPYRAESAGKAYRAYVDAIGSGQKNQPASQIDKKNTPQ